MQTFGDTGKDRATLRAGLIANGDRVMEQFSGLEHIENSLGLFARNVDADLLHCLDYDRIQPAGFESGAHCFEFLAADLIQERLSHLAARAVMNANENDSFLCHGAERLALTSSTLGSFV